MLKKRFFSVKKRNEVTHKFLINANDFYCWRAHIFVGNTRFIKLLTKYSEEKGGSGSVKIIPNQIKSIYCELRNHHQLQIYNISIFI